MARTGEDKGRVERSLREAARKSSVSSRVRLQLAGVGAGRLDELGDVARDQFFAAGGGQRRAQNSVRFLGGCGGGLLLQSDEEPADVSNAEGFEPLGTEEGHQVEPDVRLVLVEGAELPPGLDDVVQPVRQPLRELGRLGGHGHALVDLVEQLTVEEGDQDDDPGTDAEVLDRRPGEEAEDDDKGEVERHGVRCPFRGWGSGGCGRPVRRRRGCRSRRGSRSAGRCRQQCASRGRGRRMKCRPGRGRCG